MFCPETQQYCIITVLEHNGYKFKEGVTIHTIINELKLVNGFVPVTKIKHLLEKISSPVQLIIHHVKDGVFQVKLQTAQECHMINQKTHQCFTSATSWITTFSYRPCSFAKTERRRFHKNWIKRWQTIKYIRYLKSSQDIWLEIEETKEICWWWWTGRDSASNSNHGCWYSTTHQQI